MKKAVLITLVALVALMALVACGKSTDQDVQAANPNAATPAAESTTAAATDSGSAVPFANKKDNSTVQAASRVETLTIPSGTAVTVRLQNAVSSASNKAGDRFDAVLDAPLVVNGKTVAPAGAAASGRVVAAKESGRLQDPGMIQLALSSVTIDGKSVPVSTSSVIARGASHKKRNWAMIGGGAGGGALIGGLMGGGKGALIGSAVGAGAGTTTAYATGKKDVGFGVERRLTFRLREPIAVR